MVTTGVMTAFKVTIIIMLFYSMCITMVTYSLPEDAKVYMTGFETETDFSLESIGTDVEESLTTQTNVPVIEVGALVFYTGNIILDLLLNFAYAIPQMIGLVLHGLAVLFNFDNFIWSTIQLFASVTITVLYFIGLIQILSGVRSGRVI